MPYQIDNYYPPEAQVSAAEFIKKTGGPLNITKTHGLGSGIYGIIHGTPNKDYTRSNWLVHVATMRNPVILDTDEKTAAFIHFSQTLIDFVEAYISRGAPAAQLLDQLNLVLPTLTPIAQYLFPKVATTSQGLYNAFSSVLNRFATAYKNARHGDFLYQPINYLLMPVGYDGIYNSSPDGNTFAKGSVYFNGANPRHQKYAFDLQGPKLPLGNQLIQVGGRRIFRKSRKSRVSKKTRKQKKYRKY
jgi:hypothetical protein